MKVSIGCDVWEIGQAICTEWVNDRRADGRSLDALQHSYQCPIIELIAKTKAAVGGEASSLCLRDNDIAIQSDAVFVTIRDARMGRDDVWEVTALGDTEQIKAIFNELGQSFEDFHSATLHWWYIGSNGVTSTRVALEVPRQFTPLMYPMKPFNGDPIGYMNRYFDSQASILFLLGPPGTGKTSLLRQFIWEKELSAFVTYDEKVLNDDAMFIRFMGGRSRRRGGFNPEGETADLMILEDVTELLQNREMQKNEMMARFLNVSDGLIQFPHKKMIFTTNLPSLKDIDPAMLRPGRCFGMVEMRPLFYEEAVAACEAAKLPIPLERRDYSMSELYNQGLVAPVANRIGMI